ncbi:MAG: hypothetical protein C4288_15100 [Leptolyngbya sp. ERB_1_1]
MQELLGRSSLSKRIRAKIQRELQTFIESIRQTFKQRFPWKLAKSVPLRYAVFQDPIDCILYAFTLKNKPYFIQVGANDGINGDPLYEFILKWNWSGIKIEPVSYIFNKLKTNFQNFPDIILENSAIAKENSIQTFYYLKQDEDAPEWYSQLGSFSLPTLLKHSQWIPDLQERLVTSNVSCLTIEALCHKHNIQSVDVIHIDTEGYDFEVIKLIDFEKLAPTIILYEHKHLSEEDRTLCNQHLQNLGYQLFSNQRDTLAVLEAEIMSDLQLRQAWNLIVGKR